jgi:integrase
MYYAGLRPEEAVSLRRDDVTPPQGDDWGELHFRNASPDDGGERTGGVSGRELPTITYRRSWTKARQVALTPEEQASPLARRPYDPRHACVSTWLNSGVATTQVAEWAGRGVDVLLRIYAKCLAGQDELAKRRKSETLREGAGEQQPDDPGAGDQEAGQDGDNDTGHG